MLSFLMAGVTSHHLSVWLAPIYLLNPSTLVIPSGRFSLTQEAVVLTPVFPKAPDRDNNLEQLTRELNMNLDFLNGNPWGEWNS